MSEEFAPTFIPAPGTWLEVKTWCGWGFSWISVEVLNTLPPFTTGKYCGMELRGSKYWRLEVKEISQHLHSKEKPSELLTLTPKFEFRRPADMEVPNDRWRFL